MSAARGSWKQPLGSTSALTNASGAVVERQSYEPFGATAASSLTRYGYTGREQDALTGLLHYREREYDAEQGRFLSEDPGGWQVSPNLYAYVWNDPINLVDPSGEIPAVVAAVLVGAGVGALEGGISAAIAGGSWGDIGRAAASGAIEGGVGVFGGPFGGILGNVAAQMFEMGMGWRCEFDWVEAGFAGAFGAVGGRRGRGGGRRGHGGTGRNGLDDWGGSGNRRNAHGGGRRKPGSTGQRKGTDALRAENKRAREALKKAMKDLGIDPSEFNDLSEDFHDHLQRIQQDEGRTFSYKEIVEAAKDFITPDR